MTSEVAGGTTWHAFMMKKEIFGVRNAASVFNAATETFDKDHTAYLRHLSLPISRPKNIVNGKRRNYCFHFQKEGLYKSNAQTRKTLQYDVGQEPSSGFNIGSQQLYYPNKDLKIIEIK